MFYMQILIIPIIISSKNFINENFVEISTRYYIMR